MIITITINTNDDGPLSDTEKAILRALGGDTTPPQAATPAKAAPAKAAPAKATPAKAEPPKATQAETDPEPTATEPTPDDSTDDEKMEVAVARAAAMISAGQTADLRAVLTDIGVKRVSELAGEGLDTFLAKTA